MDTHLLSFAPRFRRMSSLNKDFLRKAEKVTAFNFTPRDFKSLNNKKEIQHLFNKHIFPHFDLSKTLETVDKDGLNVLIEELKGENPTEFLKMHNYNLKGIGPGEVTLFFLVDSGYLGGGSSGGIDLLCSGTDKYEIKAVVVDKNRIASDFKLRSAVNVAGVMSSLTELQFATLGVGWPSEISKRTINQMRILAPAAFKDIEITYAAAAAEYFKKHKVIFINNSKNMSKVGTIEEIKLIRKKDIMIERVTSGTVKPQIQLT